MQFKKSLQQPDTINKRSSKTHTIYRRLKSNVSTSKEKKNDRLKLITKVASAAKSPAEQSACVKIKHSRLVIGVWVRGGDFWGCVALNSWVCAFEWGRKREGKKKNFFKKEKSHWEQTVTDWEHVSHIHTLKLEGKKIQMNYTCRFKKLLRFSFCRHFS